MEHKGNKINGDGWFNGLRRYTSKTIRTPPANHFMARNVIGPLKRL
jgi:hypothetical protein